MTPEQCAYIAGIVDGEGTIQCVRKIQKRTNRPNNPFHRITYIRLEVPQVDKGLIDYLKNTTGVGNVHMRTFKNKNWKNQWRWTCGYRQCELVLRQIYPYLILKKDKAKAVIKHYDKKKSNR